MYPKAITLLVMFKQAQVRLDSTTHLGLLDCNCRQPTMVNMMPGNQSNFPAVHAAMNRTYSYNKLARTFLCYAILKWCSCGLT